MKPNFRNSDVSAEAASCYNPDDRNTVEKDKAIQMMKDEKLLKTFEQDKLDEKEMHFKQE